MREYQAVSVYRICYVVGCALENIAHAALSVKMIRHLLQGGQRFSLQCSRERS